MLTFRAIQGLSIGTMFLYWGVRFITNPFHLHPMMLIMAILAAFISEVSYRAGKAEKDSVQVNSK